jgi:hypothetical protein
MSQLQIRQAVKWSAPWMKPERKALAAFLKKSKILKGRTIVGIGTIMGALDGDTTTTAGLQGRYLLRLISYTMHDLGWTVHTVGRGGKISSWKK